MPIVLVLIRHYLPGYLSGGPIRSIANIVSRLNNDFCWKIITSDKDIGMTHQYTSIKVNFWNQLNNCTVFYLNNLFIYSFGTIFLIFNTKKDIVYLNSFFSPYFSIFPIIFRYILRDKTPFIIAPRGELSQGALSIKSLKKSAYIKLATTINLYKNVTWHATTKLEADEIIDIFKVSFDQVKISSVFSYSHADLHGKIDKSFIPVLNNRVDVCFLSRISRKKNLIYALEVLKKSNLNVHFTIYGPIEDNKYWQECMKVISEMPINIKVIYAGPIDPAEVLTTIAQHNIFFLPTLGENFGHVFIEAWLAGLMVLTSNLTPWRELHRLRIGWDFDLNNPQSFLDSLTEYSNMNSEERNIKSKLCVDYALSICGNNDHYLHNLDMFNSVL